MGQKFPVNAWRRHEPVPAGLYRVRIPMLREIVADGGLLRFDSPLGLTITEAGPLVGRAIYDPKAFEIGYAKMASGGAWLLGPSAWDSADGKRFQNLVWASRVEQDEDTDVLVASMAGLEVMVRVIEIDGRNAFMEFFPVEEEKAPQLGAVQEELPAVAPRSVTKEVAPPVRTAVKKAGLTWCELCTDPRQQVPKDRYNAHLEDHEAADKKAQEKNQEPPKHVALT